MTPEDEWAGAQRKADELRAAAVTSLREREKALLAELAEVRKSLAAAGRADISRKGLGEAIVDAVAGGAARGCEIAAAIGRTQASISGPIANLVRTNRLRRVRPGRYALP